MKNTLKIGVTIVAVVALTMSGVALAQTDDSTTDDSVDSTAVARIVERLQDLVTDGTITESQAQAVAETLADGFHPGPHRGHHGMRGLGDVADFLGMEPEDFRAALQEYDTLADLAAANGSSGQELIEYLVSQAEDRIAEAVENGRIDQADADEKLADLEERITEMVNADIPEFQGRPGPGRGFGPGPDGEAAEDAAFAA